MESYAELDAGEDRTTFASQVSCSLDLEQYLHAVGSIRSSVRVQYFVVGEGELVRQGLTQVPPRSEAAWTRRSGGTEGQCHHNDSGQSAV